MEINVNNPGRLIYTCTAQSGQQFKNSSYSVFGVYAKDYRINTEKLNFLLICKTLISFKKQPEVQICF